MDKNVILRRCIVTVTEFLLALLLFASLLLATASAVVSTPYFTKVAEASHYGDLAFESLKSELADLTIPSGLPIDFFEGKLDKELFKNRVASSFAAAGGANALSYSRDEIKEEFYKTALDFALTQNRVVSDQAKESLKGFADECSLRYLKYSNPSSVKLVLSYTAPLGKPLLIAFAVTIVITLSALFLLIMLCRGRDLLKHLFFSFGAASLIAGVLPLILLISQEIKRISLTSPALHSLAVSYIEGALILMAVGAAIFLLAAVAFLTADLKRQKTI